MALQDQNELIAAVGDGDIAAFERLYDIFERPEFAVALRTVHNRQRAEEVTQDSFLKVWRNASRFDADRGAVSSWIFTIANGPRSMQ